MTPPQNPAYVTIEGPVGGYTVSITGAPVFTDLAGTFATMPHAVPGGLVEGITTFVVDFPRGTSSTLHVVVMALDGTTLIDRDNIKPPCTVDAIAREVRERDPFYGVGPG